MIAGATGYLGGELLKMLLAVGYSVRCLARRPEALRAKALPGLEVVEGDVLNSGSVRAAMPGVSSACYLVHSMGSTQSFEEQDRTCWRVEAIEPDRLLRLVAEMKLPGRAVLEF